MSSPNRPLHGRLRDAVVAAALVLLAACGPHADEFGGPRTGVYVAPGASLAVPVRGVRAEQLRDTYSAPRSGGRVHSAIDIMAPRGTPVVAAGDGTILKLRTGGMGGVTVYQLARDGRTLYYYAHLQRYAAGIREGIPIQQGEVIAYVGDSGNAGAGNYHLHFSVSHLRDARRWWEGENVNPYPLLAGTAARSLEGK